jgi:hypothetical protein
VHGRCTQWEQCLTNTLTGSMQPTSMEMGGPIS